ncbi:MAG: hypothetical protein R3E02_08440 [Blastomonas sp.]
MKARLILLAAILAVFSAFPKATLAQQVAAAPTFVELARLADKSPVVVRAKVKKTAVLKAERAPGVGPDMARIYVEADVIALIRGQNGIASTIRYLVDLPRDSRGKPPKLKKQELLLFARPDPSVVGGIQLVGPGAQLPWTADTEQRTRSLITAMVAPDAPPVITGIREALHVRGNLQGEGETQIFFSTANNDPVSLTVLRRPGLAPQWAVSLTEIVDEAAAPPPPNTLLWYRLACFLPAQIPGSAMVSSSDSDNDLARRDYNYVRDQLGSCVR